MWRNGYIAGGVACLAAAGYLFYLRQNHGPTPVPKRPDGVTLESPVGLALLLKQAAVPDLSKASVILQADLRSLADEIVEEDNSSDEGDSSSDGDISDDGDSSYEDIPSDEDDPLDEDDPSSEDPLCGGDTPYLHYHLRDRDYDLTLCQRKFALRELFTTLCDSPDDRLFLINAARRLLSGLAVAANKDEEHLSKSFDRLMDYVSDGDHYASIMQELAQEGLHHLNAIDIVIELVLLGMLTYNERQPEIIIPGGFMSQLHILVDAFLPFQIVEDPPGQKYMAELKEMLLDFVEKIFSFPSAMYSCQSDLVDAIIILVAGLLQAMLSVG